MSTPERCLAQAQEAERLAALVSYERDRTSLMRQAADWRAQAAQLAATAQAQAQPAPTAGPAAPASWLGRCSRALFGGRPPRGE